MTIMKNFKFIAAALFLIILVAPSCKKDSFMTADPITTASYAELKTNMQKLWADHMIWTYATVDAFFHDPVSLQGKLNRLLQNQKDIGASVVPFYGKEAGDRLAVLLTGHIELAVPVLAAARDNNQTGLTKSLDDWYANASDIAQFLTSANPQNWPAADMEHMMKMHIDQTTEYAVFLLQSDTEKAIAKFDEAFSHMIEMADHLALGIAKQFPGKF